MAEGPAFFVFQDRASEWRWSLVAANHETVADSGEGYTSKSGCLDAITRVMQIMNDPQLHRHDGPPPR